MQLALLHLVLAFHGAGVLGRALSANRPPPKHDKSRICDCELVNDNSTVLAQKIEPVALCRLASRNRSLIAGESPAHEKPA
jgi:hypothetical protein